MCKRMYMCVCACVSVWDLKGCNETRGLYEKGGREGGRKVEGREGGREV